MFSEQASQHPLIEETIRMFNPKDSLEVNLYSAAPGGASTGTSAAVTVALVAAFDKIQDTRMSKHEIAMTAWSVETQRLGKESGIQDVICASYGGVNFIDMAKFPNSSVSQLALSSKVEVELQRRIMLVFLGKTHDSSEVHKTIIANMKTSDHHVKVFETLKQCATDSKQAILNGDFKALGEAMTRNTEGQRVLHPELICEEAQEVIDIAK